MTRVAFTFDDFTFKSLRRVTSRGGFTSMGSALGASIELQKVLQTEVAGGFSELIVRDGEGHEKRVVIPSINRLTRVDSQPVKL